MFILLADDQDKVRSALHLLLEQEPACTVTGEAADATGLLRALVVERCDLVFLDWDLPGLPAGELLRLLQLGFPTVKIVVMSTDPGDEQAALAMGVHAFVSKVAPPQQLLALVQNLLEGE
jgi:DNA-binding NarL/FixJ family response regulator